MPTIVKAGLPPKYAGRPVAIVLQELQAAQLPIIFSTDLVPSHLRVGSEPKPGDLRQIALQILAPHGLTLREGPRGTLLVVRVSPPALSGSRERRAGAPAPPKDSAVQQPQSSDPVRIEEHVDVTDRLGGRTIGSSGYALQPFAIRETAGGFENVFQVLQVAPGVAAINDKDGKLAVRGAGPEHNMVVLDGVQIHNPYRFGELTSSFLNPATASTVALDASGLDAGNGGRLSSVTVIETRDGTRERRLGGSVSMGLANGDVLLEGKLPKTESGSWWVTGRGTYYRPLARVVRQRGTFPSFADLQAKLSLHPTTQTALTTLVIEGREAERTGAREENMAPPVRFRGTNGIRLVRLGWTPNARVVATTTASDYSHSARDHDDSWGVAAPAFDRTMKVRDLAARQQLLFAIAPQHVVSAGLEVHRVRSSWTMAGMRSELFWRGLGPSTWGEQIEYPPVGAVSSNLSRTQVGFWLQDLVPIGARVTVEPGIRLDRNSLTHESAWQPRLRVAARLGTTAVWAGFAAQAQTPSHESLQGFDYFQFPDDGAGLRNERSHQVVAGFEQALGRVSIRVEGYRRRFDRLLVQRLETDDERAQRLSGYNLPADLPPDDVILERRPTVHPESTGRGTASGVEVLAQRAGNRLSWSVAYTVSRTRRQAYGYSFPFDFDRPQAFAGTASWQLMTRVRLSGTWLGASGFAFTPTHDEVTFVQFQLPDGTPDPILRVYRKQDGSLLFSPNPPMRRLSLRNADRLSGYSRVDLRGTYATLGHWEFYGEVINLFKTKNYRETVNGPDFSGSGRYTTSNDVYANFERIPSFGIRVKF